MPRARPTHKSMLESPATIVETSASMAYSFKLACIFTANLRHLAPDSNVFKATPKQIPMQGQYSLSFDVDDAELTRLTCRHSNLRPGDLGATVTVELRLEWINPSEEFVTLKAKSYGHGSQPRRASNGNAYDGWALDVDLNAIGAKHLRFEAVASTVQNYRFTAKIVQNPARTQKNETEIGDFDTATRLAGINLDPLPFDICFAFPKPGSDRPLELWTSSALLSTESPYFQDMLTSEYQETLPRRAKRPRLDSTAKIVVESPAELHPDWLDSDDEADTRYQHNSGASSRRSPNDELELEYRQVTVTGSAYTTYRAVLLWLHCGYIDFAPLNSSLSPRGPTSNKTREEVYKESLDAAPTLPLPASPKSVYRLAHLLQLPELQELALGALAASLTVEGAAGDFFSPVSLAYDEVRDVVREFVLEHVGEVTATPAWKEASSKAAQRSTEDDLMVMMELFEGLAV